MSRLLHTLCVGEYTLLPRELKRRAGQICIIFSQFGFLMERMKKFLISTAGLVSRTRRRPDVESHDSEMRRLAFALHGLFAF
jgi:hypothetical protein